MEDYLIVGSGRLAKHLSYYFTLLGLPFRRWSRARIFNQFSEDSLSEKKDILDPEKRLQIMVDETRKVLLAISDDALEPFVKARPYLAQKTLIHFSGVLNLPGVHSAHPLMTFGPQLYDLKTYETIPFVTVTGGHLFQDLFPELKNPSVAMRAEDKALYHALCSMAANFPMILWSELQADFLRMGLPNNLFVPLLEKSLENFKNLGPSALTGPLIRHDRKTIEKHLAVLKGNPLYDVYQAFLKFYQTTSLQKEPPHEHLGL